jgi:hypothetical protein
MQRTGVTMGTNRTGTVRSSASPQSSIYKEKKNASVGAEALIPPKSPIYKEKKEKTRKCTRKKRKKTLKC